MTAAAPSPDPAPTAGGRATLGLAFLLSSIAALGPLSIDLYLPATPAMASQLAASPGAIQMTIAVFMAGGGAGQLVFGPLSDRFGRRGPAIGGLIVYVLACAGCAVAADVETLIGFRLLQALGVCAGQVAARALLADLFEPREMARFSSLMSMITLVAPIIAPLLGGIIFSAFGWRPIFWTLAGYGVAVLVFIVASLPETRTRAAQIVSRGESAWASYLAVARNRPLMQMALASAFGQGAFAVYLAGAPGLIIGHYGVPASQFGLYFAANSVGLWLGASINRRLLKRHEPQQVLRWTSLAYVGFAFLLLAAAQIPAVGKWGVLAPLFLIVSTFPMVIGNTQALAQGMDRARGGSVVAVIGVTGAAAAFCGIGMAALLGDTLHDLSARPMSYVMVTGAALCAGLFLTGRRPRLRA